MNQLVATTDTEIQNILAPVSGQMVEMAGGGEHAQKLVSRIYSTLNIAVRETPEILDCTADSLQTEILKCAADGLLPDSKEAVILPYKNKITKDGKTTWALTANYQPMVYGIIKRMRELGGVHTIVVECVYEKDTFHVNLADLTDTTHEFDIFASERGEIVGAYCIISEKDGTVLHREVMSKKDLDKVRNASKSPESPAWKVWYTEMYRKAVLRRASKFISIDNSRFHDMISRIDAMFDMQASQAAKQIDRADPFRADYQAPTQAIEGSTDATPDEADHRSSDSQADADATDEEKSALCSLMTKLYDSLGGLSLGQTVDEIKANGDATRKDFEASLKTKISQEMAQQIWRGFDACLQGTADPGASRSHWEQMLSPQE